MGETISAIKANELANQKKKLKQYSEASGVDKKTRDDAKKQSEEIKKKLNNAQLGN